MSEQFDSCRPIYAQLVERLKARILAGTYPPGGHLDSVRDLAAAAGVNPNTMQRALAQLETEGLVRTERTSGRYVTEDTELIEQLRTEAARKLAEEFLVKMRGIGYSPARAAALLEQLDTPEPRRATHVQPTPHEDLRAQGPAFAQLQTAVEQHRECHFAYKGTPRHTQPYRLIHKNGVWYLAAEEAGRLKNFSVALIEALRVNETSRFAPKPKHLDYINTKDDVWFTESTTEVLLRVAPEAAHYFARRQLLPQQQHRADADGSLLVTTHINHVNQLLPAAV